MSPVEGWRKREEKRRARRSFVWRFLVRPSWNGVRCPSPFSEIKGGDGRRAMGDGCTTGLFGVGPCRPRMLVHFPARSLIWSSKARTRLVPGEQKRSQMVTCPSRDAIHFSPNTRVDWLATPHYHNSSLPYAQRICGIWPLRHHNLLNARSQRRIAGTNRSPQTAHNTPSFPIAFTRDSIHLFVSANKVIASLLEPRRRVASTIQNKKKN